MPFMNNIYLLPDLRNPYPELALIVREEGKEAFLAVYDNTKDRIATFLYASYRFLIVACRFVLDKGKIEGKATMLV